MGKKPIARQVRERIGRAQAGWVFTPFDFLDLGSPHAVGMALLRLTADGRVRRIARGVYDAPRTHGTLGLLAPEPDAVAEALARRGSARVQPSVVTAANLLRLSEQVPARLDYETDGRSRSVTVGNQTIRLKETGRRKLSANAVSNLVFAALRGIGRENVNEGRVAHLRTALSAADRKRLLRDLPKAPVWMHPFIRFIAGGVGAEAGT